MTGFSVDPETLTEFGLEVIQRAPFSELATAARSIAIPDAPTASSLAIERFTTRLGRDLHDLSAVTGSLGRATRSAAASYQEVDDSIRSMSTP